MKTCWHHHPETIDRLAAEYALGTLPAPARRRFEALMRDRQDISQAVWHWHDTLSGALVSQKSLPLDPAQWPRLEARLHAQASTPAAATGTAASHRADKPGRAVSWWSRWLSPMPAGALALGLMAGLAMPPLYEALHGGARLTQLPESYVGVLATADGRPGLIVSSLRKGLIVDIKQVTPVEVPAGQTLYLWSIDKSGQPHAIAPVPRRPNQRFFSLSLAQPSEQVFQNTQELAVSLETEGRMPARPAGAFVYRGLCGKIWAPAH